MHLKELRKGLIDQADAAAAQRDNHQQPADDGEVREKVIRLGDEVRSRAFPKRVIHDGYRYQEQQQ